MSTSPTCPECGSELLTHSGNCVLCQMRDERWAEKDAAVIRAAEERARRDAIHAVASDMESNCALERMYRSRCYMFKGFGVHIGGRWYGIDGIDEERLDPNEGGDHVLRIGHAYPGENGKYQVLDCGAVHWTTAAYLCQLEVDRDELGRRLNEAQAKLDEYDKKRKAGKGRYDVTGLRDGIKRQEAWAFLSILRRDGSVCRFCKQPSPDLQIDHIQPITHGGSNDLSNLQLLCPICNLAKSNHWLEEGGAE